ncbi:MAG: hypothetical protein J3R72DRAFT_491415 [Linnemannia gamsii]|nr:MAG: hypothetical protein J3R72DRAFT_491415 [Linnemannia gamsii]
MIPKQALSSAIQSAAKKPRTNKATKVTKMRLQKLARLEDLEVFGFGGVSNWITERELRWMAETWPKLKVMRGLKLRELKDAQPDRRMDLLRNFMISLRPRVKHSMLGAEQ